MRDLKACFGSYIEPAVDSEVTNMMDFRTHRCIALSSMGNWQGLTQCFDLVTGKIVVQRTINVLSMPDKIIKKLNWWGRSKKNKAF